MTTPMSLHPRIARRRLSLSLIPALLAGLSAVRGGPVDIPPSAEPRVAAGKNLSAPGLIASRGSHQAYFRVGKGDAIYTRDLLVAIPGFEIALAPASKNVSLKLWGNLPELSSSPVRESAVILHDSKSFDLDLSLVRGRIVVTNTRAKGEATVWLRVGTGVRLTLHEPGDSVALESYGRWPAGEPFSRMPKPGEIPLSLWEVYCLKGNLELESDKTTWAMSAAGASYFHGDSVAGAAESGPVKRATPAWADPKATPPLAATIKAVVATYAGKAREKPPEEVAGEMLELADKEKDARIARAVREIAIHAMIAMDEPEKVAELLGDSKNAEVRQIAILGLRHWIGAREGRDLKLYDMLQDDLRYSRAEAEAVLQLLHSPFDRNQAETFETLIAFLKHRKQAIRELAHWHLVRLAPVGRDIPFDAAATVAARAMSAEAWKKLIPDGELPPDKKKP
jgi:hypothetical protein